MAISHQGPSPPAYQGHATPQFGSLCAEMRVLMAACALDGRVAPEGGIDPGRLLHLAHLHRVAPLVHAARERLALPGDAREPLSAAFSTARRRAFLLEEDLARALATLNAASAPTILLKGAHLMRAAYPDPALRPMSDLDLLIRPEHAQSALAALREAGYRTDPGQAAFGLRADREVRLERPGHAVVDLHTDLNRPTRHHAFPMDVLWSRSEPAPVHNQAAWALSPADHLVFLCAHALPHAFTQLIWLRDIAGLAAHVSDEGVLEAARAGRACRAAYAGLSLAARILGAPVDAELLAELGGKRTRRLSALLDPSELYGGPTGGAGFTTARSVRFRVAFSDTPADALSILLACARRKALMWRAQG